MAFEYRSLEVAFPGEKPTRLSSDSSSTLQAIDDLDYLSSDSDLCYKSSICGIASRWARSKWLWAVHAALLFTSCGMLAMTVLLRSSTLSHIRQISAWCKLIITRYDISKQLMVYTAPADVSVQYSHVRYNLTTKGNRFVGAGPEVDEAWREISYDSKCSMNYSVNKQIWHWCKSGWPMDTKARHLEAGYARHFTQGQSSCHWRRRL